MAPSNTNTGAYAQWVSINNVNASPGAGSDFVIKNARLSWGKFYKDGNKDNEIPASGINFTTVAAGDSYRIYSCGRESASSGTEGSYDVFDKTGKLIRHVYWDCPWGSSRNTFNVTGGNTSWIVQHEGGSLNGGALGDITVTFVKYK